MVDDDYIQVNRRLWNAKAELHFDTPYYNVKDFLGNKKFLSLSYIELDLIGDVKDKRILHLQCHFGLDTMSLARLGAKQVIGVDLSNVAIEMANNLAQKTSLADRVQFICCDIYDLENNLSAENQFDLVFTSFGTVKWFPDLNKWSQLIERYLTQNGTFVIVDFHPMLWTFDDAFKLLGHHSYFNRGPIVESTKGTYANQDASIQEQSVRWNHSLADIVMTLLNQNFNLGVFKEFDSLPMEAFLNMEQSINDQQFRFKNISGKIPLAYALKFEKTKQSKSRSTSN